MKGHSQCIILLFTHVRIYFYRTHTHIRIFQINLHSQVQKNYSQFMIIYLSHYFYIFAYKFIILHIVIKQQKKKNNFATVNKNSFSKFCKTRRFFFIVSFFFSIPESCFSRIRIFFCFRE